MLGFSIVVIVISDRLQFWQKMRFAGTSENFVAYGKSRASITGGSLTP